MSKKSRLSTKPGINKLPVSSDNWVENREPIQDEAKGKVKRITFEVSEQQHQATKILAAQKGMTIKELMLSLLLAELIEHQ